MRLLIKGGGPLGLAAHIPDGDGAPLCGTRLKRSDWSIHDLPATSVVVCANCKRIEAATIEQRVAWRIAPGTALHWESNAVDTRAKRELKVGDRIELIQPISGVAVGTQGTVLRRFTFDPFYDICFDGYAEPRLVNKRELVATLPEA